MQPAPPIADEAERLEALRRYLVLDTADETVFDDITRLAASLCQTPIALVSLVDGQRQWFKSRFGLSARQTPREISFCGHAIAGREIFEVPDSLLDSRFADNPLVCGAPNVRFYAGVPLLSPGGRALGTLCVIDHVPRTLSAEQRASLAALARHVVSLFELRIAHAEIRQAAELAKIHATLEENRRFLTNVLNSLPNLVSYVDRDLRYLYVNAAYEKWFGVKSADLLGRRGYDVAGESAVGAVRPQIERVLSGEPAEFDGYIPFRHGATREVHINFVPDKLPDGTVQGFITVVQDLTEVRSQEAALWESNKFRQLILDNANYSIISTDQHGVIKTFNRAAERMFGYRAEEMIGKRAPIEIHDLREIEARARELSAELGRKVEPGFDTFTAKSLTGALDEHEWTCIRRDGTRFPVKLSVSAIRGKLGELMGFLGIAEDISEAKRYHDEILKAKEAALTAVRTKSEFLANISHEIRTPMNGVIGMCNLLLGEPILPAQAERLKIIQHCGDTMLNLINDVLDFSKLEAGKVELERESFALAQTTREIVEMLGERAREKGLAVSLEIEPTVPEWVRGDATRFRQVLTNLLGNAIKFTERGSVRVGCQARPAGQNSEIEFFVADTGIGIAPAERERLFASFSQADASTTRRFGGTGLGLVISKSLCEKMGGRIWVESEAGKGATFFFTIVAPAGRPPEKRENPDAAAWDAGMGARLPLKVLLAEDNRVNQLVATGMLAKLGYRCDVAANGIEVLHALERQSYDLVLMDCHMPELDGFAATREIRRRHGPGGPGQVQILALTASTLPEDAERCRQSGMDHFIGKPLQMAELVRALEFCASRAGERKA